MPTLNWIGKDKVVTHLNEYTARIKEKIEQLETKFMEENFMKMLDADKIIVKPKYEFPKSHTLQQVGAAIPKSLYDREEAFNDFEATVINDVANLPNVEWWTRNVEKKDFYINGFINHYPDFIIKTKNGKIVLLETKGDHLDAAAKLRLGQLWAARSGNEYRYYLAYDKRDDIDGSYTKAKFIAQLKQL